MVNMKRICYIHVGMGKTGSSALQYTLTNNRDYLLQHGFLYPDISNNLEKALSEVPTAGNAVEIFLALKHKGGKQAVELLRPFFDRSENLLISCEGLSHLTFPRLKEFVDELKSFEYDAKCLVFFRPHTEWFLSHFIQSVKTGKIGVEKPLVEYIDEYLSKPNRWDWHMRARKLERVFGRNNLKVKWYPAVVRRGLSEVSNAAFDWLGLSLPENNPDTFNKMINPSPSREALAVLQMVNSQGLGDVAFTYEFLAIAQKEGLLVNKIMLSPEIKERIETITFDSNAKLLERYCPELSVQEELKKSVNLDYADHIDKQITDQLIKIAADILPKLNIQYLYDAAGTTA